MAYLVTKMPTQAAQAWPGLAWQALLAIALTRTHKLAAYIARPWTSIRGWASSDSSRGCTGAVGWLSRMPCSVSTLCIMQESAGCAQSIVLTDATVNAVFCWVLQ